jgi:hypothetical protein
VVGRVNLAAAISRPALFKNNPPGPIAPTTREKQMDELKIIDASGYDAVSFGDLKISTAVFEFFSNAANLGSKFQFIAREGDNLTVRAFPPEVTQK